MSCICTGRNTQLKDALCADSMSRICFPYCKSIRHKHWKPLNPCNHLLTHCIGFTVLWRLHFKRNCDFCHLFHSRGTERRRQWWRQKNEASVKELLQCGFPSKNPKPLGCVKPCSVSFLGTKLTWDINILCVAYDYQRLSHPFEWQIVDTLLSFPVFHSCGIWDRV